MTGFVIHIQEDDLLPPAKGKPSIDERHREAWTKQGGTYVGVAISIPPALIMGVFSRSWGKPLKGFQHILDEARLVLDRRQGPRGAGDEEHDRPR